MPMGQAHALQAAPHQPKEQDVTAVDHRELVAALRAVPGVTDAGVTPDDDGGLGTLRLDLEPGVDEAAVASTVGRLLREQFGLGVDADRVQIVEDAVVDLEPQATVPEQRMVGRPAISRMHLVSSGLDVTASVTLSSGERTAVGEARGAASQSGVHRAVATATLRAVEELVDGQMRCELDHLEVTPMGNERTVLVSLTLLTSKGTERLTGAAGVREDVRQAVIRATLDALNRRLEMLLTEA
jgi:hypothetical protein